MSQNANNSPADDEEILDLTEVAEPGKPVDAIAQDATSLGAADPKGDFGADLDALLDSLSPGAPAVEAPNAPAVASPPETPFVPTKPVAAPIEDQVPANHPIDPHEAMGVPEMADIDALLAELGAAVPEDAAATPEAVTADPSDTAAAPTPDSTVAQALPSPKAAEAASAAVSAIPAVPASPAGAPIADFEGILAQAQAADKQKAAEETAARIASVTPTPAPAAKAAQPVALSQPVIPPQPVIQAQPVASSLPAAADAEEREALDLNELDALLDEIVAIAPKMKAPAESAPAPAPVSAPPAEEGEDDEVIAVPDMALMPPFEPDPALLARLQRLEDAVEVLETVNNNQISDEMVQDMVEKKIAMLLEPGHPLMEKIISSVIAVMMGEGDDTFRVNLEKMSAAAAAKVIREEIAALMHEE
ncbi:hypothetical protein FACS1894168_3060 [Deltaproteobacteria bacterium]|nr:hypothetical protein FACS1894168_3060 [Deltaproteobacteria bacterium]